MKLKKFYLIRQDKNAPVYRYSKNFESTPVVSFTVIKQYSGRPIDVYTAEMVKTPEMVICANGINITTKKLYSVCVMKIGKKSYLKYCDVHMYSSYSTDWLGDKIYVNNEDVKIVVDSCFPSARLILL